MGENNKLSLFSKDSKLQLIIDGEEYIRILPMNYIVEDSKLYELKEEKDEEGNTKIIKILVSTVVPILLDIISNEDSGEEKVKIAIYKYGKWKVGIFPKDLVFSHLEIIKLSPFGLPITTLNAKAFVKYFSKCELINIETLPPIQAVTKLGWRKNFKIFVPFTNEIVVDLDYKLQKWLEGYTQNGSLEEWVNEMKSLRNNTLFRFILSSSFAAPLLRILGHRIFVVYNYGDSRAGKSAMLHTALSVWGNPENLMCTFNTTAVGMERLAGLFNDLVLGIDEKQIQKSQNELEKLIFMLSSGTGKVRGNKTGGVQELNTFNVLVLATGEQTITTEESTTGVATRILELEGSPFNYKEELSSKMYETTQKYYGAAGRKYIEILINKYSQDNYKTLKNIFEEIKTELKSKTTNDIYSYISSVAVIVLADVIVSKELFGEINKDESIKMGLNILEKLGTSQEIDVVEKAYLEITSWILSNYKAFDKYKTDYKTEYDDTESSSFKESFGLFDKGVYYVHTSILKEWLRKHNYSTRKIIDGLADRHYIDVNISESGKVEKAIQKKFRGVNNRMYAFPTPFDLKERMEKKLLEEQKEREIKREQEIAKQFKEKQQLHANEAR